MQIAIFTDSYHPYISGVVRSTDTFAADLRALGHEVYVFAPAYPGYTRREGPVFRFFSLPSFAYQGFRLGVPVSWRLLSTLQDLRIQVVHVQSPFLLGQLGAWAAARLGLPLVFTHHTFYHKYAHYAPFGRHWAAGVIARFTRRFCDRCDLVIAPSMAVRAFLEEEGVRTPVEVIPTGLRAERFRDGDPAWLRERLAGCAGPVLLYAGRVAREKNLAFLLDVLVRLRQDHPAARLVLAGGGPGGPELEARARELGISGQVFLLGRVNDQQLAACFAGADVFLFPSLTETQGLVVAEAMAAGLPVVAVAASGTNDTVAHGKDGLLCPPEPGAFAAVIHDVLSNEALRGRLAAGAREKAAALSSGAMAARLAEAYGRLARGRGAAARARGRQS